MITNCFLLAIDPLLSRILENAAGCALGSAIAIIISIFIYRESNRKVLEAAEAQRLSDEGIRTADELNQMRAFKVLIQRSIRTSELWSAGIKQFAIELKNHPVVFPLPVTTSIANLKRIIDTISVEKTGRAYMKHFAGEKSAGEFISILEVIDYLYAEFSALQETIKMASLNHNNRLSEVSDKFDTLDKIIIDNIANILEPLGSQLREIKSNFVRNRGDASNVHTVNNLYFVPISNLMKKLIDNGIINDFITKMTYASSKGTEFYSYVGSGYDRFAVEALEIENKINANIEKLKVLSERIVQSSLV